MIVAIMFSASITAHAQTSEADIAGAKEKLKSGLKDKVVLPEQYAPANGFTIADYNRFHELNLRMRPIGDDLAGFMIRPPMQGGLDAAVRTQDCMIRLAGNFDGVGAKLDTVGLLVGLAAKMGDETDQFVVTQLLSLNASGFLEQLKYHQQMLDSTVQRCSQDGATIAKGQEISRIYKDAGSLVQSIAERIGASPKQ